MNKFVLESEEPSTDPEKNTKLRCKKETDGWFRINLGRDEDEYGSECEYQEPEIKCRDIEIRLSDK